MAPSPPPIPAASTTTTSNTNPIVPGTTFPEEPSEPTPKPQHPADHASPLTTPGPKINNRPTTITIYNPSQLLASNLLPSLTKLINHGFSHGHGNSGVLPASIQRLLNDNQFQEEIGKAPGTFTSVVRYAQPSNPSSSSGEDLSSGSDEFEGIIGTASAWCFSGKIASATADSSSSSTQKHEQEKRESSFSRKKRSQEGSEEWELKLLVTEPGLQRQGLAGLLMGMVEGEVRRRFSEAEGREGGEVKGGGEGSKKLVMLLSTIKEINHGFYTRKGYVFDEEVWIEKGSYGSETGFTVSHYSKVMI